MTKNQARLLAKVRRAGAIKANTLGTYEYRSAWPLKDDGWIVIEPCGECDACKTYQGKGRDFNCEKPTLKPVFVCP